VERVAERLSADRGANASFPGECKMMSLLFLQLKLLLDCSLIAASLLLHCCFIAASLLLHCCFISASLLRPNHI
jgi:hypothetical protein